jgi:hypothetical protein
MQGIIELPVGEGSFLIIVTFIAIAVMAIATIFLFQSHSPSGWVKKQTAGGIWTTVPGAGFVRSGMFITIVAVGLMLAGILAFLGYYYVAAQPLVSDYFWNLIAVGAIAILIGTIVAYGIANLGLYSRGLIK